MDATQPKPVAVAPAPEPRPVAPQPELRAVPSQPQVRPIPPQAAAPHPAAPAVEPPRAVSTGTIRIPGMDQPAPVSTSAPVSKFDFGKTPAPTAIRQEPLSTLSERLASQDPSTARVESVAPAPVRIPSSLTPVSENKSFAESPVLPVGKPAPTPVVSAAPIAPAPADGVGRRPGDFSFDFGFAQNPPAAPAPLVVQPLSPAVDPIAALIEADMVDSASPAHAAEAPEEVAPTPAPEPPRAAPIQVVTPIRPVSAAPQPARPTIAQVSTNAPKPAASAPIPLKPVSVPPRPPESDRFAISPGVGLNVKPAAGQPLNAPQARVPEPAPVHDESDPMSEIESLIGEAVRVELSPGPVRVQATNSVAPHVALETESDLEREIAHRPAQPAAAPVVPPLTTQFAPRRANLKDDSSSRSAEEAILAAAAASGAEVGRIEPAVGDESPYRRLKVKPQRSSLLSGGVRQYVGMAVAGTLLLAAGLGLYWVLNMGHSSATGANAPQLTAETTPIKEKPAEVAKPVTDAAKSPVLARMDGASATPSSEQLVSTDQATGDVTRDVTPSATDDNENGLANRKVRTVTVRPDGTIVSGDDAVAGGEELPVDRPNVPTVPSTEATNLLSDDAQGSAPLALQAPSASVDFAPTDTQVAETTAPIIDSTIVAPVPMQFPVRTVASRPAALTPPANSSVNAIVGAQTPNGQIDLLAGNDDAQVAAAKPVQTTPPAGGSAAAYVQLSSQPTQADAQASIRTMTAKYGSLFGGAKLTVQQVDLGQKGVRWRVRLPVGSLSDAGNVCAQIKAQGGDCFATNG